MARQGCWLTLVLALLLAAPTLSMIVPFSNQVFFTYTEPLLRSDSSRVEFDVDCVANATFSWLVFTGESTLVGMPANDDEVIITCPKQPYDIPRTNGTFNVSDDGTEDPDAGNSLYLYENQTLWQANSPRFCKSRVTEDATFCCHPYAGLYYNGDIKIIAGGTFRCDDHERHHAVINLPSDGEYTVWLQADNSTISGQVEFFNDGSLLPADLAPLRIFYEVMASFYVVIGFFWLVLMVCNYHDLLRLQFWISAVIALGMVEMWVAFADLDTVRRTGKYNLGVLVLSKLLLASKNALARVLVLLVSMGFGVVKPRIGTAFKQIVALGLSYLFFAAAYGIVHGVEQSKHQTSSRTEMMIVIPLSLLDAALLWWIFMSLQRTSKMLALRQNASKLELYDRFKWVLVGCVTATVIFSIWVMYDRLGPENRSQPDWRTEWLHEAYWHMLFFVILLAIMFLWRPTINNTRYAYASLETDINDEEDGMVLPHFAADTMKTRTMSARGHTPPPVREPTEVEDDLQWVEENIPSAVTANDHKLGSFPLDSDEEAMNTRFELSKMQ